LGEIPPEPGAAAERDLNVVGPLARSARDLRLLLSVLAPGPLAAKAPAAALGGLKVALWLDDPAFILDAEVKTTLEGFASDLAAEGAHVEAVSSPTPGEALLSVYQALLLPLMTLTMDERRYRRLRLLRGPASLFSAHSARARTVRDLTLSHRDWLIANERRAVITRTMRMFFGRYDVLIAPIAPVTAFPHTPGRYAQRSLRCSDGRKIPYESMIHWIALASACGLPATAAPVGFGASGLPVGAQIIGPRGGDAKTLAVAQAVEERLGGFRSPPMDWRGYKAD
jgi:amidase